MAKAAKGKKRADKPSKRAPEKGSHREHGHGHSHAVPAADAASGGSVDTFTVVGIIGLAIVLFLAMAPDGKSAGHGGASKDSHAPAASAPELIEPTPEETDEAEEGELELVEEESDAAADPEDTDGIDGEPVEDEPAEAPAPEGETETGPGAPGTPPPVPTAAAPEPKPEPKPAAPPKPATPPKPAAPPKAPAGGSDDNPY